MASRQPVDKELKCSACGDEFLFTAGEQELHRLRGINSPPEQCPWCTRLTGAPKRRSGLRPEPV